MTEFSQSIVIKRQLMKFFKETIEDTIDEIRNTYSGSIFRILKNNKNKHSLY